MSLTEVEKMFFLKKSNRITGPFPMLKLKAMFREGRLSCDDQYSQDKVKWHSIGGLFPELRRPHDAEKESLPGKSDAVAEKAPVAPAAPAAPVVPVAPVAPVAPVPEKVNAASPAAVSLVPLQTQVPPESLFESGKKSSPFKLFCMDVASCIALIWNFRESLQKHHAKSKRFYFIALFIHYTLGVLFAILFGRCYAVRYGLFLTPLLGVVLISIVLAAVSFYAYLIVRKTVPATPEQREERQLLAAGLFMNYGALTCTVLALAHGVMQYAWCAALLFFIDSALLCSSVMQLRDHAEENNRKWEKTALIHILLFNPLLVLLIYFFIKLM